MKTGRESGRFVDRGGSDDDDGSDGGCDADEYGRILVLAPRSCAWRGVNNSLVGPALRRMSCCNHYAPLAVELCERLHSQFNYDKRGEVSAFNGCATGR